MPLMTYNLRAMSEESQKVFGPIKAKIRVSQLILDNFDQLDEEDNYVKAEAIKEVLRLQQEAAKMTDEIGLLKKQN